MGQLNSEVPGYLAELSKELNFTLVYISTGSKLFHLSHSLSDAHHSVPADYVFDGTNPPYSPTSLPNPLNLYGKQKRGGEEAILSAHGAQAIILRVPIL